MKRNSNEKTKEEKTMKKIISILSIIICLTVFYGTPKGTLVLPMYPGMKSNTLKDYGMHEIGCGKYEYTNNSTIPEVPDNLL